jgi:hypothetical protein
MRHNMTLTQFGKAIVGSAVGAVTYPVWVVPQELRHLPEATFSAYKAIWRENRIGPNLKTVIFATMPIAVLAVPPLMVVGGAIYGLFRGAFSTFKDGFTGIFRAVKEDTAKVDNLLAGEFIPKLYDYYPKPLPDGKKPFDISPFQMVKSLVSATATVAIGAPLMFATAVMRLPQLYVRALREIFRKAMAGWLMNILFFILLTVALALIPPLALFAAVCANVGLGAVRGYRYGIREAIIRMFKDVRELNKMLSSIATKS